MADAMKDMEMLAPARTRLRDTRRLSSQSVNRSDLYGGPAVVGPPESMSRRSSAHQTAAAMEVARHRLAEGPELETPPDDSGALDSGRDGHENC